MELVYLWVEEYKNIHRQGFNFSPRFECEFKDEYDEEGKLKDNCELIICDKKKKECKDNDYIENFFGDNINVTAIVGKNGSGKSNLLNLIFNEHNAKVFFIVKIDTRRLQVYGIDLSACKNNKIDINKLKEKDTFRVDKIKRGKRVKKNLAFYTPLLQDSFTDNPQIYKNKFNLSPVDLLSEYAKMKFENLYATYESNNIQNIIEMLQSGKDLQLPFNPPTELYIMFAPNLVPNNGQAILKKIEENSLKKGNNSFSIKLKSIPKDLIQEYSKILALSDVTPFLEFSWSPKLSTGQQTFISQFALFYKNINDSMILLIDEGESTLHPEWQRMYIKYVIDFFKHNVKNKKIHIILTSHSPLILSDLPKENVIFLDTYKKHEDANQEEGNCKNVTQATNINPFGANIHTLLSNGFFMEGGLMGEFAKGKINEIKIFYEKIKSNDNPKQKYSTEYTKKIKSFQDIQRIIGEPFLKTIIGNYLDELYLIFADDKTLIDKELQEIETRKSYLEELINAKN